MVVLTLGDLGRAEARLNQDISALGSQSGGNSLGEGINTSEKGSTALDTELELLIPLLVG